MKRLLARAEAAHLPGYPDFLAALLHARGVDSAEAARAYLNPSLDQLHDPLLMHGMQEARDLILQAIKQGDRIVVYGDYDADGICASAILLLALGRLKADAFSYIPLRQSEGYGINEEAVRSLATQAQLLISVDCGVTAVAQTSLAQQLGMQVIITDHHSLPEKLPQADALVHPGISPYPFPSLCGGGVAWKLACALLGRDEALDLLDLAALATVADLVPLKDENRVITALGLSRMQQRDRPGLKALLAASDIQESTRLLAHHLAFQLAPRINAGGRLKSAEDALALLLETDEARARELAERLDAYNRERRAVELQVQKEASEQVKHLNLAGLRSIVLTGQGWNPGVLGLVASKLAERWTYPSIVLTQVDGFWTGSGRSAGPVDLYDALSQCQDLFTRFGGHRMAAGLSLPKDNLDAFILRFDQAVRQQLGEGDLVPELVYDVPLSLSQVSLDTVEALRGLEPFGLGNPSPVFLLEGLSLVSSRAVGSDGAHLKLRVSADGSTRDGIAFGLGSQHDKLGDDLGMLCSVECNEFNGRVSAQLMVRALLPGKQAFVQSSKYEARSVLLPMAAPESGKQVDAKPLHALPETMPTRGTLLIAHTWSAAQELATLFPDMETATLQAPDPRAFSAILYAPDWSLPQAPYERLIFVDGMPPGSAALAQVATAALQVYVLPETTGYEALVDSLRPSLEQLRQAYTKLKNGQTNALSDSIGRDLAIFIIFQQLDLLELDDTLSPKRMLPMQRIAPERSRLYRGLTSNP